MMIWRKTLLSGALATAIAVGQSAQPGQPTQAKYLKHVYGPQQLVRTAIGTIWGQVWNIPREWHRSPAGFGKRFVSGLGENAVKVSVEYGIAALRHEDLRYHRSDLTGFKPRLRYAVINTFWTTKTTNGQRTFAVGRTSGNIAAGFISRLWQPARVRTFAGGATTAGILTGTEVGIHVVQEFWPEIRHPHSHPKPPANAIRP